MMCCHVMWLVTELAWRGKQAVIGRFIAKDYRMLTQKYIYMPMMQKIYKVISQMPDQSHLCSSCKFSKELVRWMAITPKYRKVQNSLISPKNQFNTQYHIVHANNIFSREATFY